MRAKGLVLLCALLAYLSIALVLLSAQWERSSTMNLRIEGLHALENKVEMLQASLAHSIINLQDAMKSGNPKDLDTDLLHMASDVLRLEQSYPELSPHREFVTRFVSNLDGNMASESVEALRRDLDAMADRVAAISNGLHESKNVLTAGHLKNQTLIAVIGIGLSLGGVALLGVVVVVFVNQLVRDLKKLEAHAMEVVSGAEGEPLEVTRQDEVGGLMRAINRMRVELRRRERQIELSRQQRFYQEKMAAIGSLAAGVAHEINNPIAAISGVAQRMTEIRQSRRCSAALCQPDLILEQTQRVAGISRQLADLVGTNSQEPDLLDLNGLIERTSSFLGYDKRFTGIDIVLELDRDLPAAHAVADHLTQVLMNLMFNAADALESASGRERVIRVATRFAGGALELAVIDNGHGMEPSLLSRVFDEAFTTKPLAKGRGLGLFLCKILIEQGGGRIELESTPNVGTTARVILPLRQGAAARAGHA